jgi:plasmid stabilization system protein ParE
MYQIAIPDNVMEDIFEIKEYIFRMSFSLESANKIYDEIMSNILTLKIFPSMYPVFENNLRVLTIKSKYRVFYEIDEYKKDVTVQYIY